MKPVPRIVAVHSGAFHADDVFAVAALSLLFPEIRVIRSRELAVLAKADMRVDVGGKYNPRTGDFDHHQALGAGKRKNGVPYAGCGLVWKHFGVKLCGKFCTNIIDERLIQTIDSNDVGNSEYSRGLEFVPYTVSEMIESMNPIDHLETHSENVAFAGAVRVAKIILTREIIRAKQMLISQRMITGALERAGPKEYIVLDTHVEFRELLMGVPRILFVVYKSGKNDWRVRTVQKRKGSFDVRKPLPKKWSALKDEAFARVTGVPDAVFCHRARFIAGAKSKEGAIMLAEIAILS